MIPHRFFILLASLAVLIPALFLVSCADNPSSATGGLIVADQQYYPVTEGSIWQYRIDTVGAGGGLVRDVERRTVRIGRQVRINDTLSYSLQAMETTNGEGKTIDTTYVRKTDMGLFFSSPALQAVSQLPGLFGGVTIPREMLILPRGAREGDSWEIYKLTFALPNIPFLQYYIQVNADFQGVGSVITEQAEWRDCAQIRIRVDILLPNPTDPTNILNPLRIRSDASFWFTRPFGLVMADGAEMVFDLVRGNPLAIIQAVFAGAQANRKRLHQELLLMDVRQPNDICVARGGRY